MIPQESYLVPLSGSAGGVPISVGAGPTPIHTSGPAATIDEVDVYFVNSDVLAADVVVDVGAAVVILALQPKTAERLQVSLDGSASPIVMQASSAGANIKAMGVARRATPQIS